MRSTNLRTALATIALAGAGNSAWAITFTEPSLDFGNIDTFAVFTEPEGPIYQKGTQIFAKALTFSIDEAAEMAMQMQIYGKTQYVDHFTTNHYKLFDAALSVYDSEHALVGIAKPTATQYGYCSRFTPFCTEHSGLSLTTQLAAGTYTIEVTGVYGHPGWGPEIDIGVAKASWVTEEAYYRLMAPVPEPATMASMGLGLIALGALRRKQAKAA